MDDTISRQAAIDAITVRADRCAENFSTDDPFWEGLVIAKSIIKGLPPVQAATSVQPERKKGKWILVKGSNGKDYHKCSECLHTQDITGVKNYCPVCGADMMGEENG